MEELHPPSAVLCVTNSETEEGPRTETSFGIKIEVFCHVKLINLNVVLLNVHSNEALRYHIHVCGAYHPCI